MAGNWSDPSQDWSDPHRTWQGERYPTRWSDDQAVWSDERYTWGGDLVAAAYLDAAGTAAAVVTATGVATVKRAGSGTAAIVVTATGVAQSNPHVDADLEDTYVGPVSGVTSIGDPIAGVTVLEGNTNPLLGPVGAQPFLHSEWKRAIRNGDFHDAPPFPLLPINNTDNVLPGWLTADTSSGTIQGFWVADATTGSGGRLDIIEGASPTGAWAIYQDVAIRSTSTRNNSLALITSASSPTNSGSHDMLAHGVDEYDSTGALVVGGLPIAAIPFSGTALVDRPSTMPASVAAATASARVTLGVGNPPFAISLFADSTISVYETQLVDPPPLGLFPDLSDPTLPPGVIKEFSGSLLLNSGDGYVWPNALRLPIDPPLGTTSGFIGWDTAGKQVKVTDELGGVHTLLDTAAAAAGYQPLDSDLTAIAALTTTSYGRAFLALANAAAARTAIGTVIGTDVEAHDTDLTTFAGLSPTNDDVLQRKAGAWANRSIAQLLTDLAAAGTTFQPLDSDLTAIAALSTTSFGRSLLAAADASALRTLAGTVIGTNVEAWDADLDAIAALAATAGMLSRTGAGAFAVRTIAGGTGITVTNGDGAAGAPSVAVSDAELLALAGLTSAADSFPYFTGSGTASLLVIVSAVRTVLASATLALFRSNAGLAIGTDVQAYDAELAALAGLTSAADSFPYFTGSGTASLLTIVSAIRTLLASANVSTFRTNAGLAIGTDVQAYDAELAALAGLTSAADKVPYFTGSGAAAVADFTAAARTVVDDTTVGAMVDTLGGASATGTGGLARKTSPALITPSLDKATATTIVVTAAANTDIPLKAVGAASQSVDYVEILDSSGNVLVRVPSIGGMDWRNLVAAPLHFDQYSNDTTAFAFQSRKSRATTMDGQTVVQSGDNVGNFAFQGSDGTGFINAARIRAQIDGTPGTNDMPGRLIFDTTPDGSATATERLRIDSNGALTIADAGNLIVGTTTGTKVGTATTQKLGFWNATPIVQPSSANEATVAAGYTTTGATGATAGAFDTAAHRDSIISTLEAVRVLTVQLRADLVAAGIIKGSA